MNALAKTHPPFTSAEFYRMAERGAFGGMRVELRRGMILKMSPQHYPHGAVQGALVHALIVAVQDSGAGWAVLVGTTISYGGGFEPMPDIVVVDPALLPEESGPVPPAAVKLVVEVSDATLADDMGEKREDYARAGLAEYWVADVNARLVTRHADPQDGKYAVESVLTLDEALPMLTRPDVVAKVG